MAQYGERSWDWARVNTTLAEPSDLVLAARGIIAARTVMADRMPPGFTGEPAVMILLHLFVERENGHMWTIRDLAAATGQGQPTVARWCKALEHKQLLLCRTAVELTEAGVGLVVDIVTAVIESHARLLGMPPAV